MHEVRSLRVYFLAVRKGTGLTGGNTSPLSARYPPPDLDPASVPYTLLGVGGNIERRDSRTRKVTDEVISRRSPGVPDHMHYFSGRNLDEISLVRLLGCTSRLAAVSVRDSRPGGMQVHQGSSHPPFRAATPGVQKHFTVRMLCSVLPSVLKHVC